MRVLMVNHPGAEGFRGGDVVQMRKTAAALRFHGVAVTESFAPDPNPTGFDLAHVFNLRTARDTLAQLTHLKGFGIPVVLSPLYLDLGVGLWGTRAVAGLLQDDPDTDLLTRRLANLRDRNVNVTLPGQGVYTAHTPNRPYPGFDREQKAVLDLADFLLVNSLLELHTLARTLKAPNRPFAVAPVGIDPEVFRNPDPEPFVLAHGRRDFVLCVGRIEGAKNQLLLALACRRLGLPLVLIGSCRHPPFLENVKKHGPADLHVIPHLPQEELASAYAAARVHALPSWAETCGLVNLEAALCGAAVVAGTLGYEVEYLHDLADYCDPADVDSIAAAVQTAWGGHAAGAARRELLRHRILERFTWAASAEATFRAYCRVLNRG